MPRVAARIKEVHYKHATVYHVFDFVESVSTQIQAPIVSTSGLSVTQLHDSPFSRPRPLPSSTVTTTPFHPLQFVIGAVGQPDHSVSFASTKCQRTDI